MLKWENAFRERRICERDNKFETRWRCQICVCEWCEDEVVDPNIYTIGSHLHQDIEFVYKCNANSKYIRLWGFEFDATMMQNANSAFVFAWVCVFFLLSQQLLFRVDLFFINIKFKYERMNWNYWMAIANTSGCFKRRWCERRLANGN